MTRFQRQLAKAQKEINTLHDEHLIVLHEMREIIAENKRLKFRRWQDEHPPTFQHELVQAEEARALDRRVRGGLLTPQCGPTFVVGEEDPRHPHSALPKGKVDWRNTLRDVLENAKAKSDAPYWARTVVLYEGPYVDTLVRTKVGSYFDVAKWKWVATAVIPYRVRR